MEKKAYKILQMVFGAIFMALFLLLLFMNRGTLLSAAAEIYRGKPITEVTASLDTNLGNGFVYKDDLVDLNGLAHVVFGQKKMNGIYRLDNGHGTAQSSTYMSDETLANSADTIKRFSDWCAQRGTTVTFAQSLYKNQNGTLQMPPGMTCYSYVNANRFRDMLLERNVGYVDMRVAADNCGMDFYDLFYKTEHHWNCFGAFYGFVALCEYLRDTYGDEIDPKVLDFDNYQVDVYEDRHSGYYGSRTGNYFLPAEDFYMMYPKFETKQTCTIPHKEIFRSGSFYDAIFELSYLEEEPPYGLYGTYIGGDYPLVIHESETAENDGTVMIFIDSFGNHTESFLTTAYKRVIAIDLRHQANLYGPGNYRPDIAYQYVEEYNPDHVVIMYNPALVHGGVLLENCD